MSTETMLTDTAGPASGAPGDACDTPPDPLSATASAAAAQLHPSSAGTRVPATSVGGDPQSLSAPSRARVLLVDDEPNILSALRRALRPCGFEVHTADGGEAGLAFLESNEIDAVISDMRMPGMSGAEFLAQVRVHRPQVVRILLTGYADVSSAMAAVNGGEIFRYLCKPWSDEQVVTALHDGLERQKLQRERDALLALTRTQNEALRTLNDELESRVAARTAELQTASERIKSDFMSTVRMFASMLERRAGVGAGCSRKVATLVRQLGPRVDLDVEEVQDVTFAALLEDIGKTALPDRCLESPFSALDHSDRALFLRHPLIGESYLMALPSLHGAARLLRALYERFDGRGTPHGLAGEAIPLGARVLRVASDYERLRAGALERQRPEPEAACQWIAKGSGSRYDPAVVRALIEICAAPVKERHRVVELSASQLEVGMVLARDLVSPGGVLLLAQDHLLDAQLIARLYAHEETYGTAVRVAVYA
jgi:response regulator RpfG family c-di-GMP phosphodiesterase